MNTQQIKDRLRGLTRRRLSPGGRPPSVAVIGAGFGGLCMGIRLKHLGIDSFTIYEKQDAVGGTWHDNTYPGAACDVPSHLYSFSFELSPDWSRRFPPRDEIHAYQQRLVETYDLARHLKLGTAVEALTFDDSTARWTLRLNTGEEVTADVVVSGLGQLNIPAYPDVPGIEDFAGEQFHSARWDHGVDLVGKSVAVIGNGASAVQFVPPVAEEAAHLTVFQRSANWVMPKPDKRFSDEQRARFGRQRWRMRIYRSAIYWLFESRWFTLHKGSWTGRRMEQVAIKGLTEQFADEELRRKLIPDYPMGCKRILISNDYLPTLARDDVDVVSDHITRVTESGIVTADGTEHPIDVIIFGTGFEATNFLAGVDVKGVNGASLHDAWREGADAYLGVAVTGFPNLFLLYGPNTNLGHNSIIFMIEAQVHYILKLLAARARRGAATVEVQAGAQDVFNRDLQDAALDTVWAAGCDSWYKTSTGKITNNWTRSSINYWLQTRRPKLDAFTFRPR